MRTGKDLRDCALTITEMQVPGAMYAPGILQDIQFFGRAASASAASMASRL